MFRVMVFLSVFVAWCCTALFAQNDHLTPPSLVNITAGASAMVSDCVQAITGDYCYNTTDYTLTGKDPYILGRSYSCSSEEKRVLGHGWSFYHPDTLQVYQPHGINYAKTAFPVSDDEMFYPYIPEEDDDEFSEEDDEEEELLQHSEETLQAMQVFENEVIDGLFDELEPKKKPPYSEKNPYTQLVLSQAGGGALVFSGDGWATHFKPKLKKTGWTNAAGSEIGGKTNVKNIWVHRDRAHDRFLVRDGDGNVRIYTRKSKQKKDRLLAGSRNYHVRNYLLREERRPSGNRVLYTYSKRHRLIEVRTVNAKKTKTLNWVTFSNKEKEVQVKTSDGYAFTFEKGKSGKKRGVKQVKNPLNPREILSYSKKWQLEKTQRGDSYLGVTYGKKNVKRVSSLTAPAGRRGEKIAIHRFKYCKGDQPHTTVTDACGNATKFYHDKNKRLVKKKICNTRGETELVEKFQWGGGDDDGNLLRHTVYDKSGKQLLAKHYTYDDRNNVTKEEVLGCFTGISSEPESCVSKYSYSGTSLNLQTVCVNAAGHKTEYQYKPRTDLKTAVFLYDGKRIAKRCFFSYNDAGILVEEIVDDGSTKHRDQLDDVHHRFIKKITPRNCYPHFGDSEVVEEWAYDPASKQNVFVKKIENLYNEKGLVVEKRIYDQNRECIATSSFSYDHLGRLIQLIDPAGNMITSDYDEFGHLVYTKGPQPDYERFVSYDKMGRPSQFKECIGKETLISHVRYDEMGRKIATCDAQGNETKYAYDTLGRVISITYPPVLTASGERVCCRKQFSYSEGGLVVHETDSLGYVTMIKKNVLGKPLEIHFPDGTRKYFQYDYLGNLNLEISQTGVFTRYWYDYQNRLIETRKYFANRGESTILRYDAFHLLEEESPTGEIIRFQYDFMGRKIASSIVSQGQTREQTFHYDAAGRLIQERTYVDSGYRSKNFSYDCLDRVIAEITSDDQEKVYDRHEQTYDADGNVITQTRYIENKPSTTTTQYLPKKLPVKIVDALGNTTTIQYDHFFCDGFGNRVLKKTVIDPNGQLVEEIYNVQGLIAAVNCFDPFGKQIAKERRFYDTEGRLIQTVEGVERDVVTALSYNSVGQLEKLIQAAHTPEAKETRYFYNKYGQLASTLHANGSYVTCAYDCRDRLSKHASDSFEYLYTYDLHNRVIRAENGRTKQATTRKYDGLGNLVEEVLESGICLRYDYDVVGRVRKVILPDASSVSYHYTPGALSFACRLDAAGNELYRYTVDKRDSDRAISKATLPDGSVLSCTRDPLGRVAAWSHPTLSQTVSYDAVGNITQVVTKDPEKRDVANYTYDGLYQLTGEPGHTYSYDSLFNRTAKDGDSYRVNSLHSLLSAGSATFTYDAVGNRCTKRTDSEETSYEYDDLDRLTSITTNGVTTRYGYDAFHRRVSKETDGEKSFFLYSGENELGRCDKDGRVIEFRFLGEGLGAEIGASIALELAGIPYVPIHDYKGDVRALRDLSGNVVEWYRYTAFGEEQVFDQSGQAVTPINPWRFSSKRVDDESGLIFYGRRYYDATYGRWLTQDPLGLKAGPNLYAFVKNRAMTHFDLYGLIEQTATRDSGSAGRGFVDRMRDFAQGVWSGIRTAFDGLCSGVTSVRNGACIVAEQVVHHGIFINCDLKYAIRNTFRGFRGAPPIQREKSQVMPLKVCENSGKTNFFIVGMNNNVDEAEKSCATIFQALNKSGKEVENFLLAYNETFGLIGDFLHYALIKLGGTTQEVRNLANSLQKVYEAAKEKGLQPQIRCHAHSKGGLILSRALQLVSEAVRKAVEVSTYGSAEIILQKDTGVAHAANSVHATDLVSYLSSPLNFIRGLFSGEVRIPGPWFSFPLSRHSFGSVPYQSELHRNVQEPVPVGG